MDRVTLFDDHYLFPSFFVLGFRRLAEAGAIRLRTARGKDCPIPHEVKKWKSLAFTATRGTTTRLGYIDIFDSFQSLHVPTIEQADAYFKFNYDPQHIHKAIPEPLRRKLHPTGFHFPLNAGPQAGRLRTLAAAVRAGLGADRGRTPVQTLKDARVTLHFARQLLDRFLSYEDYTVRHADDPERTLDLFWNVSYWQPEHDTQGVTSNQRMEVMRILDRIRRTSSYKMTFGFVEKPEAVRDCPEFVLKPSPTTREYIETLGKTRMSIVTRGLQECFSWRMGEHLALRRFALMEIPHNTARVPLVDGEHTVFFRSDLADLDEKIRYYLDHDAERERIAAAGRSYWDTHCAPEVQARSMLDTLFSRGD